MMVTRNPNDENDVRAEAGEEVQEWMLCEQRHLTWRSDVLYLFTVAPDCKACAEMKAEQDEDDAALATLVKPPFVGDAPYTPKSQLDLSVTEGAIFTTALDNEVTGDEGCLYDFSCTDGCLDPECDDDLTPRYCGEPTFMGTLYCQDMAHQPEGGQS